MNTLTHARAIIDTLEAAGLTVGDHQRPSSIPEDPSDPDWERYTILFLLPGGSVDGTAANPDEDFDGRFQLTNVGANAAEARYQAKAAHDAITAGFTVAGRSIQRVRPLDANGRIDRDDDVSPPLLYAVRTYGFFSFPT